MPNITTCSRCGALYEETSEELANSEQRLCNACWLVGNGWLDCREEKCPECGEPGCPWWNQRRAHELATRGMDDVIAITEKGRAMLDSTDVPGPDRS